jgi:hypothetical protein
LAILKFGDQDTSKKNVFRGKICPQKITQPLGNIHPYDDEE